MYDVTDEGSFRNVSNWMQNIQHHASDKVNKILVGNKSDMAPEKRAVSYGAGQELAREYNIPFFETSAKTGAHVEEVFMCISRRVLQRLKHEEEAGLSTDLQLPNFGIGHERIGYSKKKRRLRCCH